MGEKIRAANVITGAATALRGLAELTANNNHDWDNYEAICLQVSKQVFEAGKTSQKELKQNG